MAFDIPIVVSDCLSQKNLVEQFDCGAVHIAENASDFASKVIDLYENKKLYKRQSENAGRAIRESLNWDLVALELFELYEGLESDMKDNVH